MNLAPMTSVPRTLTELIGREQDVVAARNRLQQPDVRLLTLTGPGGIGKTRLAIEIANAMVEHSRVGVCYVSLAPVAEASLVLPAVLESLGIRDFGDGPVATLVAHLRPFQFLLVLDNFEHVLPAAPSLVPLLMECPGLKVLVTSRAQLRLRGEHQFDVPSLPVPGSTAPPALADLHNVAAVELFLTRARAVAPQFALTEANAGAIAEICRRLDGLPLAIELAAARMRVLEPAALLTRLDHRLSILASGPRDAPPRLQTLRDAIEWSHALVPPPERRLFRRLSVFAGGWSLPAAEAICGEWAGRDESSVFNSLAELVDQSLVQPAGDSEGEPRFVMLESIRAFAREQLERSGEAGQVCLRHARWYVSLAEQAQTALLGPDQRQWLDLLERERQNVRMAGIWSAEHEPVLSLQLAGALGRFWGVRGHSIDERNWLERAIEATLADPGADSRAALAQAFHILGNLHFDRSEYGDSRASYNQAVTYWREIGGLPGEAGSHVNLALVGLCQNELSLARADAEHALRINEQLGAREKAAQVKSVLGAVASRQGEFAEAKHLFQEALAVQDAAGDIRMVSYTCNFASELAVMERDFDQATSWAERALTLTNDIRERRGIASSLVNLGRVANLREDHATATGHFAEAFALRMELGDQRGVAEAIEGLACSLVERDAVHGVRLLAVSGELRDRIDSPPGPLDRDTREQVTKLSRRALAPEAFAAAWAAGRLLPLDVAVGEALALTRKVTTTPEAAPETSLLTGREREVLGLLAEGYADRQIAEMLYVSHTTARTHVANIYAKLGVKSRSAAAAYAHRNGYV